MKIRILTDYTLMPIWVNRVTKKVTVDWYGDEVEIGEIGLSEGDYIENEEGVPELFQSWMFYENEDIELRDYPAPEGRHNLGDFMDDTMMEKISDIASDHADDWFNGTWEGVFVGSPTKLLMGAELDHGGGE